MAGFITGAGFSIRAAAITAGVTAALLAVPAVAHPDNRGQSGRDHQYGQSMNQRHSRDNQHSMSQRRQDARWLNQKRQQSQARAYDRGYQSGRQANNGYYNNGYYNNGYNNNGYYNNGGYPVYNGAYSNNAGYRSNSPYWWGPQGQMNCRRTDGTTGVIVGALAGGTLGNVIAGDGNRTLGSVIGGALGAVLGKEVASGNARCR